MKKSLTLICIGLCVSVIIAIYLWHISLLPTKMVMYVFDTKGNPSVFIRTPDDKRVLIDGGANGDIIRNLTRVLPFYSKHLDLVVATSDDRNDVTGLIDIINRYKVDSVLIPKITSKDLHISSSTDQIYETFLNTAHALDIPIKEVVRGDQEDIADELKIDVLFPVLIDHASTSQKEFTYTKSSSPEMVLKIVYGDMSAKTSILLLGDIGLKAQKFLLNSNVKSDVLIIFHSPSATSLSLDLMNQVQPQSIVYSQSVTNSKNLASPTKNKVDPLYMILRDHRFNIKQKSTIEVLSDGESIEVR